jgi:hypothetical protein
MNRLKSLPNPTFLRIALTVHTVLGMSSHNTPTIDYDGPEADSILSRLLSRIPSFPDNIPSSSTLIE